MHTVLFVPSLPASVIPSPWSTTFGILDQHTPLLLVKPIFQMRLDMETADWRIANYWVVKKKWHSKLKIPLKRNQAKLYEPWGELLYRTLELCDRCYDSTQPYLHAADWYLQLSQEAKWLGYRAILANAASGKTQAVKERYAIVADLKALINPVNPETSPHFHRLVEAALRLEHQDEFNDRYWKPFLQACSRWTQLTDSPQCQETLIEGNKIRQRCGQGKGKITLLSLP